MSSDARLILVVEDHQKIRLSTMMHLRDAGYVAEGVGSAEEAEAFLREREPDLLLLDVRLSGASGVDFIRHLAASGGFPPTIIVSGEASMTETLEALHLGVYDFVQKPFTRERLLQSVRNCLENIALRRELSTLQTRLGQDARILGRSPQIEQLRARVEKVAATSSRVLIRGESGSGKELVAQAIHRRSTRRGAAFVETNCAAIPQHLIEDELFGHARGAFTDAREAKSGLFEEANHGTLFLDEIGDMDIGLQARLLRVLEDGKVRRIGETHDREVDVRVIAATHQPLERLVASGRFREDLYFRLNAVPIDVPPLRDRHEDIALLFAHFLEHFCKANQRRQLSIDASTFPVLESYGWPGNVRELRNVCEQLAIFGTDPITTDQLPSSIVEQNAAQETGLVRFTALTTTSLHSFKEQCEKELIENVLRRTNWNFTEAARLLDIQRTYLHRKVATLKIERSRPSR